MKVRHLSKSGKPAALWMCLWLPFILAACASSPTQVTATPGPAALVSPVPAATYTPTPAPTAPPAAFDEQRAFRDLEAQMAMGPRTPGSQAHEQAIAWMKDSFEKSGWTVEIQEATRMGHPVRNVIARRGSGSPWTIIAAHYDSRMEASQDSDPARRNQPVPAANDGASGVAVLTELARVIPRNLPGQVWLACVDAEDQGEIPGWDWLLGSRVLAESLQAKPSAVIIIDMIGDKNLNIKEELNSDKQLTQEIWDTAAGLGYDQEFIAKPGYSMIDDHTPFLELGMRAIDIIDFDYPYWHTSEDTTDKTSPHSLLVVGNTLLHWLVNSHPGG